MKIHVPSKWFLRTGTKICISKYMITPGERERRRQNQQMNDIIFVVVCEMKRYQHGWTEVFL